MGLVRVLLAAGADPHAPARSCGLSALHLALSSQGEANFLPRAWLKANALAAHANQSEDHAGAPGRGRRPAPRAPAAVPRLAARAQRVDRDTRSCLWCIAMVRYKGSLWTAHSEMARSRE